MKVKKRFIAGAACPQCGEQDSLRWWEENRIEWTECVECGNTQQRTPQGEVVSKEESGQMIGIFKPD